MKLPTELVQQWDTGLIQNRVFWTAVAANVVAQLLKILLDYALNRRWDWRRLLDTGGMPSTHSATVSALAISVAFAEGWDSPLGSSRTYSRRALPRVRSRSSWATATSRYWSGPWSGRWWPGRASAFSRTEAPGVGVIFDRV